MTGEQTGKLQVLFYRMVMVAVLALLVPIVVGIGSCARNDYNRDEACLVAGGRLIRLEGPDANNRRGCFKVDAKYEPVAVESYR